MIKINRNNYEEYMMDYLDGTLSDPDNEIVMLFLKNNPDIRAEVEGLDEIYINESHVVFDNKTELKRLAVLHDTDATIFEELCIADLEGDITKKQHVALVELLTEDLARRREYDLFKLTKISADENVVYSDKLKLKRSVSSTLWRSKRFAVLSAAASVLVLIALYFFLPRDDEFVPDKRVAETSYSVPNDQEKGKEKTEKSTEHITKVNTITPRITGYNSLQNKQKIEINESTNIVQDGLLKEEPVNKLNPLEISYAFNSPDYNAQLAEVIIIDYTVRKESKQYQSIGDFLASAVNKTLFKNKKEDQLELFHIAQAGVKGINKLVGGNMSLERTFDEKGVPQTTEFSSSMVAFSTPVKKNSKGL